MATDRAALVARLREHPRLYGDPGHMALVAEAADALEADEAALRDLREGIRALDGQWRYLAENDHPAESHAVKVLDAALALAPPLGE